MDRAAPPGSPGRALLPARDDLEPLPAAPSRWRLASRYLYPAGGLALALLLWELLVRLLKVPGYLLPPPSVIVGTAFTAHQELLGHSWVTTYETLLGFALSVLVGIPLAIAIVSWEPLERATYPLLVAAQTVPKIAIAPLLVVWLGFGVFPKVIVVLLIAFFPVVINAVVGLRSVEPDMIQLARILGFGRRALFWKIVLPHALPYIFAGLKVAMTLAIIGAVVAEFVGADAGLGYLLVASAARLNTLLMFADLLYLTVLGMLFYALVELAERLILPWRVGSQVTLAGAAA